MRFFGDGYSDDDYDYDDGPTGISSIMKEDCCRDPYLPSNKPTEEKNMKKSEGTGNYIEGIGGAISKEGWDGIGGA